MGMGIGFGGFAVGGPAGMGDSDKSLEWLLFDGVGQIGHLAHSAQPFKALCIIDDGNTGRVITPVFQAP